VATIDKLIVEFGKRGDNEVVNALKKIKNEFNSTDKATSALSGTFTKLAGITAGVLGFHKLVQYGLESIHMAGEQEAAYSRLNQALKTSGQYTEETTASLDAFTKSIYQNSTYSKQAIVDTEALMVNMGAMGDQIEKGTLAAANLAAATGMDLNQAARQVAKTLGGLSGELGEQLSSVTKLTRAQREAGAAIDLVNERYKDQAFALSSTYSGALDVLIENWNDYRKTLAESYTKSEATRQSLQVLNTAVLNLTNSTESGTTLGQAFAKTLGYITTIAGNAVWAFGNLAKGILLAKAGLQTIASAILDEDSILAKWGSTIDDTFKQIVEVDGVIEKWGGGLLQLGFQLDNISTNTKKVEAVTKVAGEAIKKSGVDAKLAAEQLKNYRKIQGELKKVLEASLDPTEQIALKYMRMEMHLEGLVRKNKLTIESYRKLISLLDEAREKEGTEAVGEEWAKRAESVLKVYTNTPLDRQIKASEKAKKAADELSKSYVAAGEALENFATGVGQNAMMTFADTSLQMFELMGEAGENMTRNIGMLFLQMVNQILKGIMAQAAAKALMELAEGFAALGLTFGIPNPASIAHFTAAGIFSAIAAGAFAGSAGVSYSIGKSRREGSRQHGDPYVSRTGMYLLHEGERVVPRHENTTQNNYGGNVTIQINATDAASFTKDVLMKIEDAVRRNITLPNGSTARAAIRA